MHVASKLLKSRVRECYFMIKIVLKHRELLMRQGDRLSQEKRSLWIVASCSILEFLINDPTQ